MAPYVSGSLYFFKELIMTVFQFIIAWQPNKKELEDGLKPKILQDVTSIIAADMDQARMMASMQVPKEYAETLDQIILVVKPF